MALLRKLFDKTALLHQQRCALVCRQENRRRVFTVSAFVAHPTAGPLLQAPLVGTSAGHLRWAPSLGAFGEAYSLRVCVGVGEPVLNALRNDTALTRKSWRVTRASKTTARLSVLCL